MKKKITRKSYLFYLIIISTVFGIVLLLASKYSYLNNTFKTLFKIGSVGMCLDIIYMFYLLINLGKKQLDNISDEREHLIVSKSLSITGIVAFSLTPIITLFIFVLPEYMVLASFVYIFLIGGAMKIAVVVLYKKY